MKRRVRWNRTATVRRLICLAFLILSELFQIQAAQYVVGWGNNSDGQVSIPAGLTNVSAVAAGQQKTVIARADGSVMAWGCCSEQTNIPPGLSNVVAIAAGAFQVLALQSNGIVRAWGYNSSGEATVPSGLSNVMAIAAGDYHNLALRSNGTVVAWGYPDSRISVPTGLSNVVAIGASFNNSLALKSDGKLVMWGSFGSDTLPPANLSNVIAISGTFLALKGDHTVVAWGNNTYGQTNIPPGLTNVIGIAGNGSHNLALKQDGTLVAWGNNTFGQINIPPGLSNVTGLAVGNNFSLALVSNFDGSPVIVEHPTAPSTTYSGTSVTLSVQFEGSPTPVCQWQFNGMDIPSQTNKKLLLPDVQTNDSGAYRAIVTNSLGVATSLTAILSVTNSAPIVQSPVPSQTTSAGSTFTLQLPFAAAGSLPLAYQWWFNAVKIPGATNASLTLTNVHLSNEGNYRLTVSNAYGTATTANAYLTVIDLGIALDNENLDWNTSGDLPWRPVNEVTVYATNGYLARSGAITNSQSSVLQTTVTGPGTLSFWWRSSCQQTVDYFSFSINGTERSRLSGESSWHRETNFLATGLQTLQWVYAKGASGSAGQDSAWLDQVGFSAGAAAPNILSQPMSLNLVPGSNAVFNVTASGTPPLSYQWQFNGADLPGATNSTFLLQNIQPANNGNYRVVVSNPYGSKISSNANLNAFLFVGPSTPQDALDRWYFRSAAPVTKVRFAGNLFIGVGNNGTLVTSEDGKTWISRNSGTFANLHGVAYAPGQSSYVVVGDGIVLNSNDGTNWTTLFSTNQTLNDVAWNGSRFAAIATANAPGQPNVFRFSATGNPRMGAFFTNNPDGGFPFYGAAITVCGNQFIAAGGSQFADYIWRSSDGGNWQNVGFSDAIVQGIASDGNTSIVIGYEGWPRVSTNQGASWFVSSSSVIDPDAQKPPIYYPPNVGQDITFGNSIFLIAAFRTSFLITPDGTNWASRSLGFGASSVAFGKGTFVLATLGNTYPAGIYQSENVVTPIISSHLQTNPRAMVLNISGEVGRTYRLQSSTNFSAWSDLWLFTNSVSGNQFVDPIGQNSSQTFYRVVAP